MRGLAVSDRWVEVPGGQVFARRWALAESHKAPIVLLHDSLGSVELWRGFPAALAQATGREVWAYDRLGFGRSSPRTKPPSLGFILEEAWLYFPAIAKGLELREYILFGHSVGGAMALCIAAYQPGRCRAVITEAAQAFVEERTLQGIRAAQQGFQDPTQFARLERWHGEKARWVLEAWTGVWLAPGFRGWTLEPCLKGVRCPVLALHGDRDEYGSLAFPKRIVEGVQGPARMELLPDCGHVPHREKEALVLGLVEDFLRNIR
ncbi:2-succinyl-6-hydroxy-2,4-cyclohexadiene-1-carboxylate synthase [Meiothermus luteus]|uniref:2-succinyl-6-hydroxy-2, 4-cyclohexadiene-1-carboxylate synthase n=1 Tax=Meiothermus luteus TaxID=2026184 RepID=A0A399EZR1_9DEIN|nr:alpha/beta hydrolase [Meiothermus luteus]RIH89180.1 2-succinyl-6-hydroxy-2,4-cyclohexadiene-1-carboxylate synthase [Meiothermus luteus]RMH56906.1 MAG: alpha/beta fold hydrolase [Deinococcota bacterium]